MSVTSRDPINATSLPFHFQTKASPPPLLLVQEGTPGKIRVWPPPELPARVAEGLFLSLVRLIRTWRRSLVTYSTWRNNARVARRRLSEMSMTFILSVNEQPFTSFIQWTNQSGACLCLRSDHGTCLRHDDDGDYDDAITCTVSHSTKSSSVETNVGLWRKHWLWRNNVYLNKFTLVCWKQGGMGVGRRGKDPLVFEMWCFPVDFLVGEKCFSLSFEFVKRYSPLLPPWMKSTTSPPGNNFRRPCKWGVRSKSVP